jgi:hypothetical protein
MRMPGRASRFLPRPPEPNFPERFLSQVSHCSTGVLRHLKKRGGSSVILSRLQQSLRHFARRKK